MMRFSSLIINDFKNGSVRFLWGFADRSTIEAFFFYVGSRGTQKIEFFLCSQLFSNGLKLVDGGCLISWRCRGY